MRKAFLLVATFIIGMMAIPRASATIHVIEAGPNQTFVFTPDSLTAELGDTIKWVWKAATHTTTSDAGVGGIPAAAVPWDAPLNATDSTFMYVPAVVGEYNYHCTFHVSMGMVGKFVVIAPTSVINVASAPGIKVVPNPAYDEFSLTIGPDASVDLLDITGKLIRHLQAVSGSSTGQHYRTDNISGGMYLLRIKTGGSVFTEKLQVIK
ncbi:MAG: hypothetical protein BGO69_11645 [Bacteroidetes bacterium 46-16]|nr:MAG: hypothetical protein BGO69_11645 [Bacteroidetes bacterium 46-16]